MGLLTLLEAARVAVGLKTHAASGVLYRAIEDLERAITAAEASDPPEQGLAENIPRRAKRDAWFGRYLTPEQIADDVLKRMSAEDKVEWREAKREELIQVHHTTGRSFRNFYGLWHAENPYTHVDDPGGSRHPDQVSQRVIYLVWKRLTGEE